MDAADQPRTAESARPTRQVRHNGVVYYWRRVRDLWRKTWWVECIYCGKKAGPYPDRGFARFVKADWWGEFGVGRFCIEGEPHSDGTAPLAGTREPHQYDGYPATD